MLPFASGAQSRGPISPLAERRVSGSWRTGRPISPAKGKVPPLDLVDTLRPFYGQVADDHRHNRTAGVDRPVGGVFSYSGFDPPGHFISIRPNKITFTQLCRFPLGHGLHVVAARRWRAS